MERVFELTLRRGPSRQPAGERQPSHGRHHNGLNAVANRDLESALVVLQFGDLDRRLALAADVDKRHLRADPDDPALDGLALLDTLRFDRSLEHRGEIFRRLAHGTLQRDGYVRKQVFVIIRVGGAEGEGKEEGGSRKEEGGSTKPEIASDLVLQTSDFELPTFQSTDSRTPGADRCDTHTWRMIISGTV